MRVMVTGAGGLLGSNLVATATERSWEVIGAYHSADRIGEGPATASVQLDVTDPNRVEAVIDETAPDYVINCVAVADVDGCEQDPEHAWAVNADGAAALAAQCAETGAGFCQISTDYVYGAGLELPISESAPTGPMQVYGRTKLAAERRTQENHPGPLIARLSFLFGIHRTREAVEGLPRWILDRIRAGRQVPLYTDQQITPTYAEDAARTVLALVACSAEGVLHTSNRGCTTPHEFGRYLVEQDSAAGRADRLSESSMAAVDRLADRPWGVCLSVEAVESELGRRQPTWRDALERMVEEFEDIRLADWTDEGPADGVK